MLDYSRAKWVERIESWLYQVPWEDCNIYAYVAIVKKKNDGRYEWFRKKGFLHEKRPEPLQGVCLTLEEAQTKSIEDLRWNYEDC